MRAIFPRFPLHYTPYRGCTGRVRWHHDHRRREGDTRNSEPPRLMLAARSPGMIALWWVEGADAGGHGKRAVACKCKPEKSAVRCVDVLVPASHVDGCICCPCVLACLFSAFGVYSSTTRLEWVNHPSFCFGGAHRYPRRLWRTSG